MRRLLLAIPFCLLAGNPKPPDLPLIDKLHDLVQTRFDTPLPDRLGMSRVARPSSLGRHFQPNRTLTTDFAPENPIERDTVARLEANRAEVGIYVVGAAITKSSPALLDFRSLKGPAIVTAGTPRPAFYPQAPAFPAASDALPDWRAIYPVARRAMASFHDGGSGFETTLGTWNIAARPVTAVKRCAICHATEQHIGGVLYAFRRAKS